MFLSPFVAPAAPAAVVILAPVVKAAPAALALPEISTAEQLEEQAVADGYDKGFPPTLPPQAVSIDLRMVGGCSARVCHKRGMQPKPYHRLCDGRYRLVCSCPKCGAGEVA